MPVRPFFLLLFFSFMVHGAMAQQVTGVYKGRIKGKKVELKLVKNGDSLTGTAYYFETGVAYRRYSIKGYFNEKDNSVVWWDDQLLADKGLRLFGAPQPLLSIADINCPGGGVMVLYGKASPVDNPDKNGGPVGLTKADNPQFPDEWDYVIDNYTVGGNDPYLIDSIGKVAHAGPQPVPDVVAKAPERPRRGGMATNPPARNPESEPEPQAPPAPTQQRSNEPMVVPAPKSDPPVARQRPLPPAPLSIEEKYRKREKKLNKEIPVSGDSIELRFYDNAEIDGDSISLFLNDRLLFEHVRLTDKAYSVRLAVADIQDSADLTMVAENLGSIPPNTSYMVVMVEGRRHEAFLASTEHTSAVIRLRRGGKTP